MATRSHRMAQWPPPHMLCHAARLQPPTDPGVSHLLSARRHPLLRRRQAAGKVALDPGFGPVPQQLRGMAGGRYNCFRHRGRQSTAAAPPTPPPPSRGAGAQQTDHAGQEPKRQARAGPGRTRWMWLYGIERPWHIPAPPSPPGPPAPPACVSAAARMLCTRLLAKYCIRNRRVGGGGWGGGMCLEPVTLSAHMSKPAAGRAARPLVRQHRRVPAPGAAPRWWRPQPPLLRLAPVELLPSAASTCRAVAVVARHAPSHTKRDTRHERT